MSDEAPEQVDPQKLQGAVAENQDEKIREDLTAVSFTSQTFRSETPRPTM